MHVGKYLDLDVARCGDVALEEDGGIPESRCGLATGAVQRLGQITWPLDDAHPPAATAGRCFDQHGPSECIHGVDRRQRVGVDGDGVQRGHASGTHALFGADLRTHGFDRRGGRTHPDETCSDDGPCELGRLRQEPVARVDGVGPGGSGGLEEEVDPQVRLCGRAPRQAHR